MRILAAGLVLGAMAATGCRSDGAGTGPPVPASSDPEGRDLVVGAIVAAVEDPGGKPDGVRLYKIKQVNYFPPPVGDELVMIAYREKGNDFQHASDLWRKRDLTVVLPNVRVQRHMFMKRDYRVLTQEAVTEADKALKADDKIPARP